LYEMVEGMRRRGQEIRVDTRLVLRESTAPVRVGPSPQTA